MTSPARNPATAAGEGFPFSVGSTPSTVGTNLVWTPMAVKKIVRNRMAITKWVTGPAAITVARCHTGLAPKVRGYSSRVGGWNGFIPAIRT